MHTAAEKEGANAAREGRDGFWRYAIVWIAAAVLIVLCLGPLYALIWRGSTEARTRSKCEMVADALYEQEASSWKSTSEWMRMWRESSCVRNAIAAWAGIYGGADEEEIEQIFANGQSVAPDGLAVLTEDGYEVLTGDFPYEEFDAARQMLEKQEGSWSCSYDPKTGLTESAGTLNGNCALAMADDVWYYSTAFPVSNALVIGKAVHDVVELPDENVVLDENIDTADADIILVRLSDNTVVRVKGDLDIQAGDVIPEENQEDGWLQIGKKRYIAGMADNNIYRIYAVFPWSEVISKSMFSPLIPAALFAALFFLAVLYAWFLRNDILRGRVDQERTKSTPQELFEMLKRHMRRMFSLMAFCAVISLLLFSALYIVDDARVWGASLLDELGSFYREDDKTAIVMSESMQEHESAIADQIAFTATANSDRFSYAALQDLGSGIGRELYFLDKNGVVDAGSSADYDFSGFFDETSQLSELSPVLEGKADHVFTLIGEGENSSICLGVRRMDAPGMLVYLDQFPQVISIEEYYSNYKAPDGMLLFTIDTQSGEILSSSDGAYSGLYADSIGLKKEICENGFAGDALIDGRRYFVQTKSDENRVSLAAVSLSFLTGQYMPVMLLTIAAGLAVVLVMFLVIASAQHSVWTNLGIPESGTQEKEQSRRKEQPKEVHQKKVKKSTEQEEKEQEEKEQEEKEQEEKEQEETASFYRESGGHLFSDRSAVGRWLNLKTPFHSMSADEKFRFLIQIVIIILFALCAVMYQKKAANGVKGSAFAFLIQHTWHDGFNIYAICYAILIVVFIFVAATLVRRLIMLISKSFGSRGETIARLLGSFIGYVSVIGAFAYSLMFLGVNTMTILASAGIVGLGISIGAKDLIADILAGVSIVFEGEFRTGDIVEISGFRGQVEEIGIRTTKVMSLGNVKVFRNSEVSGVINLTQRYSVASVHVSVSRAEPLEQVEEIFKKELPRIREKIPQAVEDISMGGVVEVNTASVVLSFSTKCRESDRYKIEITLKREFDLLMERENIGSWGLWKDPEGHTPPLS